MSPPAPSPISAPDAARRRELEEERDHLLLSLDDLELEHASGAIDDESYQALHDDYTARAASVIRALRDGVDARPTSTSPRARRRQVVVVAAVLVFALVAGVALAAALGARLPGGTSSGNSQDQANRATLERLARRISTLEAQVNASRDDYDLRLQLSRAYEENGDLLNAIKQLDEAIRIDQSRPDAHAEAGRLLYLVSEQLPSADARQQYLARAAAAFAKAIAVDPDYADTYYYQAILGVARGELLRSQVSLQLYLVKAPNGRWSDRARELLARVTKALESPSTTVPSTMNP